MKTALKSLVATAVMCAVLAGCGGSSSEDASTTGPKTTWYGPAEVAFDLKVEGNPYDVAKNDVKVEFASEGGKEDRPAYYLNGKWHAILLAKAAGSYKATVVLNGKDVTTLPTAADASKPSDSAFVRVNASHDGFYADDGLPYWPVGHNLAWGGGGMPPIPETLATMGKNHMNWSRIWSCPWDGKNPYWPAEGKKISLGDFNQAAYTQWDGIVDAADKAGVRFQWVLFHHGLFSSEVDPNWPQNPWNVVNGGFLKSPIDFFTDPQAKQLTKNYLRYVVARYGHHPSILSWELFNEVENTDACRKGHQQDVDKWHKEMAEYLRSIDPYHHLVTASSSTSESFAAPFDYYQPHGYPADVQSMLLASTVLKDKPFFFGEVGLGGGKPTEAEQLRTVRDALYGGLLAGHAGAGQYWYWDVVHAQKLEGEWAELYKLMQDGQIKPGSAMKPISASVQTDGGADLVLVPGIGWGASQKLAFNLPQEGDGKNAGKLSSFLQGKNHADMGSEIEFSVNAKNPGEFVLEFGTVSANGAEVIVTVDGKTLFDKKYEGSGKDRQVDEKATAKFESGTHKVAVKNLGSDWVNVKGYRFGGLGQSAALAAATQDGKVFGRLLKQRGAAEKVATILSGLGLPDGAYKLTLTDLDTREAKPLDVKVKDGATTSPFDLGPKDAFFVLEPAH